MSNCAWVRMDGHCSEAETRAISWGRSGVKQICVSRFSLHHAKKGLWNIYLVAACYRRNIVLLYSSGVNKFDNDIIISKCKPSLHAYDINKGVIKASYTERLMACLSSMGARLHFPDIAILLFSSLHFISNNSQPPSLLPSNKWILLENFCSYIPAEWKHVESANKLSQLMRF